GFVLLRKIDDKIPRSPTLADVAKKAGVSVSTAARALGTSRYRVHPGMKQMVLAAAEELGYVPNMLARSLRGGAPTTVGIVLGDILDPYYGEIASVITTQSESAHSMLAIVCNM